MSAKRCSAGSLRQETVSSSHLPVGDQSLTMQPAGAETVQEKKAEGGNNAFIFHRRWCCGIACHTNWTAVLK